MAFSPNIDDRERDKFFETDDGETAVRVGGVGSFLDGITYDALSATYPDAVTEIYSYFEGGLAGTLKATVTVVYVNSDKDDVLTVVRT